MKIVKSKLSIPPLPKWADLILLPAINLAMALGVSAIVLLVIGQQPLQVISVMIDGALGNPRGIGYTFYYATTFIFTGLAVSVAFQGKLFNIGGEGQAVFGGVTTSLMALLIAPHLPSVITIPIIILFAAIGGALWAFIPGYLKAYRGSHEVITTIMFNFIASTILVYLLVNQLKPPGTMAVQSEAFALSANIPKIHSLLESIGIEWPSSPLNASIFLALACSVLVYVIIWRSRFGYHLRAKGSSEGAAEYAGINTKKITVYAMMLSGSLAGLVGVNELAGVQGRLTLDFVAGAGFTGIAVSLMGRNHPVGVILASILFGILFQGGAEVAFEVQGFTRNMVVALQGFIVLFSGAMAFVLAPSLAWVLFTLKITSIKAA